MKKVIEIFFDRDSNVPSFKLEDGTVKHPTGRVYLEWLTYDELEYKRMINLPTKRKWYQLLKFLL